jgi:hypothetical protein
MVTKQQITCAALFEAQGYPPESAAAWVGNFSQESGASLSTAFRTGVLDHGSQGLAQWRLERLTAYERFVRSKYIDTPSEAALWDAYGRMDYQVQFATQECAQHYPKLEAQLRRGGDIAVLTADICWQYEVPNKAKANLANRVMQARATLAGMHPIAPTSITKLNQKITAQSNKHVVSSISAATVGLGVSGFLSRAVMDHHGFPWWGWGLLCAGATAMITLIIAAVTSAKAGETAQVQLTVAHPVSAAAAAVIPAASTASLTGVSHV